MTNPTTESARDDLAFVRALVSEGGAAQATLGEALFMAGLCYGTQCVLQFAFVSGVDAPPLVQLAVGVLPTVIFIVLMIRIMVRDRGVSQHGVGTRAINAAFGGAGLAAMTTAIIFGWLSSRTHDMGTFLLHPTMICVVQGTVWYIAFAIRRRSWFGLVSLGWFSSALALAFVLGLGGPAVGPRFLAILSVAMLGLLALPGWLLWKGGTLA
jgi:hypothetical protein